MALALGAAAAQRPARVIWPFRGALALAKGDGPVAVFVGCVKEGLHGTVAIAHGGGRGNTAEDEYEERLRRRHHSRRGRGPKANADAQDDTKTIDTLQKKRQTYHLLNHCREECVV